MSRIYLINYILKNDDKFHIEEMDFYSDSELVIIKVKVELEKSKKNQKKVK
jgi:hypothetical protein